MTSWHSKQEDLITWLFENIFSHTFVKKRAALLSYIHFFVTKQLSLESRITLTNLVRDLHMCKSSSI